MDSEQLSARRLLRWALGVVVVALVVLGLSGRWGDGWLRTYVAVWAALGLLAIARIPAATARARIERGPAGVDPMSPPVFRVLGLGHVVVAALDARFQWSYAVPTGWRVAGLAVMAAAFAFVFWAVSVNRFFVPAVRIQTERGHHLVTDGPYRVVRHPGYAGLLWGIPASGLALGSWTAAVMGVVMAGFVLRRVMVEDRFVTRELAGYPDYAARVRHRLLPGIW